MKRINNLEHQLKIGEQNVNKVKHDAEMMSDELGKA